MSKDSTAAQAVNTFDGGIDKATTDKWKAQHRKVTRIEVQDGDEVHVGYFKRPNMETMTAVNKLAKTDEMKSAQVLLTGAGWAEAKLCARTPCSLPLAWVSSTRRLSLSAQA